MSKEEEPVTVVPLRPLVSAEYPEKVHLSEHQYGKNYGSPIKSWFSTITSLLDKPPPGLEFMSPGVWKCITCLVGWIVYVLLGAAIFMKLTEEYYEDEIQIPHPDWKKFRELLGATEQDDVINVNFTVIGLKESLELKENIMKICNHSFLNRTFPFELSDGEVKENEESGMDDRFHLLTNLDNVERTCRESLFSVGWVVDTTYAPPFIDVVHFIMTTLTTIGYGHIYPIHTSGQMFCVFYCLFGIPLTFILLNNFAELFSIMMLHTYKRALAHLPHQKDYLLYIVAAFLLLMGFIVLMILPATAFMFIENWSFSISFYYTFITLSTIGFGDLIAGLSHEHDDAPALTTLYKLITIIWIISALGYWLFVIKFVLKGKKTTTGNFGKMFSSPVITKQATAFRDLVWKVRNQNVDTNISNGMNVTPPQPGMMEMMNDAEGARIGDYNDEQPIITRHIKNEFTDEESDELMEFLSVKVVIRNDDAIIMKNIVSQVAKEDGELLDADQIPAEITLPLRDALNLIFSYQQ